MPFVLLLLYLILSYIYPGEVFPALVPYRITYWVGMTGLAVSAIWLVARRTPLFLPQLWMLVAFTVTLGVSQMIAEQWLGAPISAIQRFGPSVTMFVLVVCSINTLRKLRVAVACVVLLTLALVVQGAAAYHFGYKTQMFLFDPAARSEESNTSAAGESLDAPASPLQELDDQAEGAAGPVRIRGLGLLHDPNDLAMGFVVALALLGGAWAAESRIRNFLLVVLPAIALSYGVFLTHSRGGTLAVLVTLWRASRGRLGRVSAIAVFVVLAVGAVALDFAGGRQILAAGGDESATGRLTAWTEGLEMLKSQPILGIGYGQFLEHHTLTAHNSFVLCFAETGLVGYFFWLGLIVITLVQLRGLTQLPGTEPLDADLRKWAKALQLSVIGFLTAACFLSRTFVPMLYLILGLSAALVLVAKQANKPLRMPSPPRLGTLVLAVEFATIAVVYVIVKLHLA
jgi:O-antigen ligase